MQLTLAILDLCLSSTRSRKSRDYCDVIVFEKFYFQNLSTLKRKAPFSNFSGVVIQGSQVCKLY